MRKMLAVFMLSALVAWAGGGVASRYLLSSTNGNPVSATAGIPLVVNNVPLQSIYVTVADYNDGGTDSEFISSGQLQAWIYHPELGLSGGDAGLAWTRADDLTLTFGTLDSGVANNKPQAVGRTFRVPLPTPQNGPLTGSRIYYSTANLLGEDGGTPVHMILLEGRY